MTNKKLVHLGCGPFAKPTRWEDYDGSWNLRVSKLPFCLRKPIILMMGKDKIWPRHVKHLNITRRLPFADESVDAVYASHVWEHLFYAEAVSITADVYRMLRPGGVLRIAVPNLAYFVEKYLQNEDRPNAAMQLNQDLLFQERSRPTSIFSRLYKAMADFHSHKYMYDPPALIQLFVNSGFSEVAEMPALTSRIDEITDVESLDRVSPTTGFAVEGIKISS